MYAELKMAIDLAAGVVDLIERASERGPELLQEIIDTRKHILTKHSLEDLHDLQRRAIAFTTGDPAQALIWLQDVSSDEIEDALDELGTHMTQWVSRNLQDAVAKKELKIRTQATLHLTG